MDLLITPHESPSKLYHGSHMDWKSWTNGKTFFSQGKVREYWKNEGILPKILEKCGILSSFYFYVFFSDFLIDVYLLNGFLYLVNSLNKTLKKYWKTEKKILEKYWKCQGNLSVRKCGNHVVWSIEI